MTRSRRIKPLSLPVPTPLAFVAKKQNKRNEGKPLPSSAPLPSPQTVPPTPHHEKVSKKEIAIVSASVIAIYLTLLFLVKALPKILHNIFS